MANRPDHFWGEFAAMLCGAAGLVAFLLLGNALLGSICVALGVGVLAGTYLGFLRW